MKRFSVLLILALAGFVGACEKHPVSQLSLLVPAHHGGAHPHEGENLAPNEQLPGSGAAGSQNAPKYFQDKK